MKGRQSSMKRYQIPSIVRAFQIMEALSNHPSGMTITQLSRMFGLPVSSTSAILNTLHSIGYLVKEDSSFVLGTRVLEMGNRVLQEMELRKVLEIPLRKLVDRVSITAHAGILEGTSFVLIEKIEDRGFIKVNTYVGCQCHLHCTALGKTLLAFQEDQRRERLLKRLSLPRFTPNTITDVNHLRREVEKIREQGYAIDDEEEGLGIRCIGAPVFDREGKVLAAISLTGTTSQITMSNLNGLIQEVQTTARAISKKLGHLPDGRGIHALETATMS